MATIGTLIVNIQLNNTAFLTQINRTAQATQRATQQMARHVGVLDRAFLQLRRTFLTFASIAVFKNAASDIAAYADAWKLASNQVAAANTISTIQARSMEGINAIASKTRTSISETAELYAKLLRSTEGVAKSELEVAQATEIVTMAFKAGGASTQEAVNGVRQLAQSLSSGIFQGDELRSIRENAPLIAKAIADEFGTTIGGLKALGAAGELVAARVFKAILKNQQPIRDAFAATNSTIADSFVVLNNSISEWVGTNKNAVAIANFFIKGMKLLADNFEELANKILSSNGELGRFIANYHEIRALWERGTINKNKEQFAELGKVVSYVSGLLSKGVPGDAWVRLKNPITAVLTQLNLAAEGAITLGKEMGLIGVRAKLPPLEWEQFLKDLKDAEPPPFLFSMPQVSKAQVRKDFKPDTKAIDDLRNDTMQAFAALGDLAVAASQGQEAFDAMEDKIAATNQVIKAGILPTSDLGKAYVDLIVFMRDVERAFDGMINAIEGTKTTQQQIGQYKLLQLALSMSGEEYRNLAKHYEILNEAEQQNIDLTSAQGQEWLKAKTAAQALGDELERQKERYDEIAQTINSTVNSAISSISSAFADAVVEGENFRDMLDALLKDLAKLAINSVMNLFLRQILGGVGTTGTAGTGLLGGINIGGAGFHEGGIVGSEGKHRTIPAALIATAPRFHDGLMTNEFAAVLKKGEGVFTPDQMSALGGQTINNFTVINQAPNTKVTEERRENATGGMDVTATIRQIMTKEVSDPASSVHKSLKSTFGVQQAGVRR